MFVIIVLLDEKKNSMWHRQIEEMQLRDVTGSNQEIKIRHHSFPKYWAVLNLSLKIKDKKTMPLFFHYATQDKAYATQYKIDAIQDIDGAQIHKSRRWEKD